MYSKAKQDGQQVRKKRIKKQVKTKQQKETDKPIRKSEKQRAFLWETYFRGSDKRKFARSFWND